VTRRARFAAAFLVVMAALVAYGAVAGFTASDAQTCAFRALTGMPCIFCGMTHALAAAVRGNWQAASAAHPLWWVVAIAFSLIVAALYARRSSPGWPLVAAVAIASVLRLF